MDILIHRLTWQLRASNQKEALEAQKEVSEISHSASFLAELETALNTFSLPDHHVVIDQLEIDLGKISLKGHHNPIKAGLATKLKKQLAEENQRLSTENLVVKKEVNTINLFEDFITTGNMPNQLPAAIKTVKQLADWLGNQIKSSPSLLTLQIEKMHKAREFRERLFKWPLQVFWNAFAKKNALRQVMLDAEELLLKTPASNTRTIGNFRNLAWRLLDLSENQQVVQENLRLALEQIAPDLNTQDRKKLLKKAEKIAAKATIDVKESPIEPELDKPLSKNKQPNRSSIFVRNAGIVLVAPFLTSLFQHLKITKGKNIQKLKKAISTLNFIDKGSIEEQSVDTALYKILCGMDLLYPVNPEFIKLTKKECFEVEEMLTEIIVHWKVLKNTSPNGLRTGFLWREGMLEETEDNFKLKVESQAQDILLSHLPWSVGVIKLPWMIKPLHVDWI